MENKVKILFIDRDGTILVEPQPSQQIDTLAKFDFVPGAITSLARIAAQTDHRLVMVSNQDGLGTASFPREEFQPLQELMLRVLTSEGVVFDEVLIDPSLPADNSPNRKPRTGMVEKYMGMMDTENSYVIGDRETDMQLAENMGIGGMLVGGEGISWNEIAERLCGVPRRAAVTRRTAETDITIEITLDGGGRGTVRTGIGFFDHMLDQIARHGALDLKVNALGDLYVDQHHTIEDVGIVLGEALRTALGDKRGTGRYAFVLPMDEARAEVLLDLGGRSQLVWDVALNRDFVGDFPTDMTKHFFDALSRAAGCTIHVRADGENTHHTIEAIFKAFGRCLRAATRRQGNDMPSTKGTL